MNTFKNRFKSYFRNIRRLLDGTIFYNFFVLKNAGYMALAGILSICHTSNRYESERQLTEIDRLKNEISELRYEAVSAAAERMSMSRQSAVYQLVKKRGIDLEESMKAPGEICIED